MIELYKQCITLARIKAKYDGYAVAVHGTGMRDLDLVLVPWTDEAKEPASVLLNIYCAFQFEFGECNVTIHKGDLEALREKADGNIKEHSWPSSMVKPHGRAAILIHIGPNFVVDISVMPRILETKEVLPNLKVLEFKTPESSQQSS